MYKSGSTLRTSADFDNAQMFALNVLVMQDGYILDYGGKIEKITDQAIMINDSYFVKAACEFRVR